jgi:hypothetical protein
MKHKRHWSFIVTDKKYLYPIVISLISLGFILALFLNDPTQFSRIGNFIIGIGVWISMRYTLREGINRSKNLLDNSPTIPSKGYFQQVNPEFFNKIAYQIGDAHLQIHGFILVILGSIIGSYGDLIIHFILKNCN